MENNWAAENLQTIRTLMERSAIYRRALAPISTYVGIVGLVGGALGWALKIERVGQFAIFWMAVSVVALAGAFFLVRRQALKDAEPIWSPPARRVAQAMIPALLVGLVFGQLAAALQIDADDESVSLVLIHLWSVLYGLALQAAGAFMPRGIRLFGWGILVLASGSLLLIVSNTDLNRWYFAPNLLMALVFGASHLAYGIYLYFTEKRKNEA